MRPLLTNPARAEVFCDSRTLPYAARLLRDIGAEVKVGSNDAAFPTACRWTESGLASLTGMPDQPPPDCPIPLANYADAVLEAFRGLSGARSPKKLRGADLAALRARMTGRSRQGTTSPGGSCRIIPSADGRIAINLAREEDWAMLDAWLLRKTAMNWRAVEAAARRQTTQHLVYQGRLLGLAVADAIPGLPTNRSWYSAAYTARRGNNTGVPRVVDLSPLWAGPLCSLLLHWAGAEVIKVESSHRPDGARAGNRQFFDFLNGEKHHLRLDLHKPQGQRELRQLLRSADIVIEGTRPRALRQMGIVAEELLDAVPGLTWIGISGYGREEPEANWIAYGDDAGVAAGLSTLLQRSTGQWMFCGDAIADPFTGMHAALAALASWRGGGGHLISLSLMQTMQHCIAFATGLDA